MHVRRRYTGKVHPIKAWIGPSIVKRRRLRRFSDLATFHSTGGKTTKALASMSDVFIVQSFGFLGLHLISPSVSIYHLMIIESELFFSPCIKR